MQKYHSFRQTLELEQRVQVHHCREETSGSPVMVSSSETSTFSELLNLPRLNPALSTLYQYLFPPSLEDLPLLLVALCLSHTFFFKLVWITFFPSLQVKIMGDVEFSHRINLQCKHLNISIASRVLWQN